MSVVKRQGIKNAVYAYVGILLGIISTLYIQPFCLSEAEVGLTRLLISVSTILATFSNLGTNTVIVKFLPVFHNPSRKHHGIFTLAVLMPIIGFCIWLILGLVCKKTIIRFYGDNALVLSAFLLPILIMGLGISILNSFQAYCSAIDKSSPGTFFNEIFLRAGLIITVLLYYYGFVSLQGYVYAIVVVYLLVLLSLFGIIWYFDHPVLGLTFFRNNARFGDVIKFGLISMFLQITGIALKFIDIIFVGKYESMKQVGVYSIAAFAGLVLETPLGALEKIAGPKIAKLFVKGNHTDIQKMYTLSSKYLMILCGLMGSALVVCIEPLLGLLPGDYASGVWVTVIICTGAFFNAATGVNYSILMYSDVYRLSAVIYSALLAVTVLLNIWLIPLYGIAGAALASASTSVIHNLLRLSIIWYKLKMQPFGTEAARLVLIIAVAILPVLININNPYLLILFRGGSSVFIFLILIVILKVFTLQELKDEFRSLKKTFF